MIHDHDRPRVSSRGLLLGTCAALGESGGVPALVVRAGTIVALCLWFKPALLTYCSLALYYRFRR